jgi:hypothetical protein
MAVLYGEEMPPVRNVISECVMLTRAVVIVYIRCPVYNICKAIAAHASASAKA